MNDTKDNNNDGFDVSSEMESARILLMQKQFRHAKRLLRNILRYDGRNSGALKLIRQLEKRSRIIRFRITLIMIFLLTASAVAILGWTKLRSTQVAMQVEVDQLTFTLDTVWEINSLPAKAIGLTHADNIELFHDSIETVIDNDLSNKRLIRLGNGGGHHSLLIRSIIEYWNISIQSPNIKLSNLTVDSGAAVKICLDRQNSNKVRLSIFNGNVVGTIETDSVFTFKCNQCRVENGTAGSSSGNFTVFTQNREIPFRNIDNSIDMIIEFSAERPAFIETVLLRNIAIHSAVFMKDEAGKLESTITGDGKLHFVELDKKTLDLTTGDFLEFVASDEFRIKRLFIDTQINISLFGKVRELRSGSVPYSRMPTYLEWLSANHSIMIYIGTLIPLLSTILAVFYRLKIFED